MADWHFPFPLQDFQYAIDKRGIALAMDGGGGNWQWRRNVRQDSICG
jgi:hypothetical protein